MCPPHEESIRRPIASGANALSTELHLAPKKYIPVLGKSADLGQNFVTPVMEHWTEREIAQ